MLSDSFVFDSLFFIASYCSFIDAVYAINSENSNDRAFVCLLLKLIYNQCFFPVPFLGVVSYKLSSEDRIFSVFCRCLRVKN